MNCETLAAFNSKLPSVSISENMSLIVSSSFVVSSWWLYHDVRQTITLQLSVVGADSQ
jgi:hypothetical protein